ncbi:Uncharacterized protein HZ326_13763 [Fusarium oxysporum f. sp. albedinis]|nr:Uncharacterized protein HZ326_13763 [Fusarium oxysporum f. sp. albedinis]
MLIPKRRDMQVTQNDETSASNLWRCSHFSNHGVDGVFYSCESYNYISHLQCDPHAVSPSRIFLGSFLSNLT